MNCFSLLGTLSDIHYRTILEKSLQYESEFLKSLPENRRKRFYQIPKWVEKVKNRQKQIDRISPTLHIAESPKLPSLNQIHPIMHVWGPLPHQRGNTQVSEFKNRLDMCSPPISRRHMTPTSVKYIPSVCCPIISDSDIVTSPKKGTAVTMEAILL